MKIVTLFICFIVPFVSANSSAQLSSGLVAYYPFNGNANDGSGNGYHGVVNGAALSSDRFGIPNSAYEFDGLNDFIAVSNFPTINSNFTYSGWIKIKGNNWNNWIQSFGTLGPDPNHTWNFSYQNIARSWDLWDRTNGSWYTPYWGTGNTLDWTHVVIVYNANTEYLYVNDSLKNSRAVSGTITHGGGNTLLLGSDNGSPVQCLNGILDDVRIYNRPLGVEEINELYWEQSKGLVITIIPQGYYNSLANKLYKKDGVQVYLRQSVFPYSILDSAYQIIDSTTFTGIFRINPARSDSYYISVKQKNCIETWSTSPVSFLQDTIAYNFTSNISQAYGNNLIQCDASPIRFGIYSGDVNQSGFIDATDLSMIDNDANNFLTGNVVTDLTGNGFVDASDLLIADNNAYNYVRTVRP